MAAVAGLVQPTLVRAADCPEDRAISWQVEGGFAVLKGQAARRKGDMLLNAISAHNGRLSTETAADPASAYDAIVHSLVETALDDGRQLFEHTYWDRGRQEYTDTAELMSPDAVFITASFSSTSDAMCRWTVSGQAVSGRCADMQLPIKRDSISRVLQAQVAVADGSGRTAASCVRIAERLIVGLGDSYASGEGNPDRPTQWSKIPAIMDAPRRSARARKIDVLWYRNARGPLRDVPIDADAQWWDNSCHRSLLSQQALAAMAYAARDRHRRVVFLSFACSGATVVDGIVGPRFEAPGVTRLPKRARSQVPALARSQLEQVMRTLCPELAEPKPLPIDGEMRFWKQLRHQDGTPVATPLVSACARPIRTPDAILLSVGGNDIGFGGVGFWAILPPVDRGLAPIDFVTRVSVTADRKAAKRDFGLVCPDRYPDEKRCRKSAFTAQQLLNELPDVFRYMDAAMRQAGLSAPIKIHMSYPPVARDEQGELCGKLWRARTGRAYETQNEPWMPLYGEVLDTFRLGTFTPAALRGPWSFGIFNTVTAADCANHREAKLDQAREMCIIERDVFNKLNRTVAGHDGWTVLPAATLPNNHGLCAATAELGGLVTAQLADERRLINLDAIRDQARREFGWPRWRNGWNQSWPVPQDWQPYAPRARWFRTATDSALTQSAFDGGVARIDRIRSEAERHEESTSGTIHPTLQMHAAMAERVAAALEHQEN